MEKFKARVLLILTEIMNLITNVGSILMPLVMFICEVCGVPDNVLEKIKEIEYKFFEWFGTKKVLDSHSEDKKED